MWHIRSRQYYIAAIFSLVTNLIKIPYQEKHDYFVYHPNHRIRNTKDSLILSIILVDIFINVGYENSRY